jgi:hypothetical protein
MRPKKSASVMRHKINGGYQFTHVPRNPSEAQREKTEHSFELRIRIIVVWVVAVLGELMREWGRHFVTIMVAGRLEWGVAGDAWGSTERSRKNNITEYRVDPRKWCVA